MHLHHLPLLICPTCQASLRVAQTQSQEGQRLLEGTLQCTSCPRQYPVRGAVPRFVPAENYSSSFGYQWILHARTQYDSFTQIPISRQRLFQETRWPEKLNGQTVLEVGSGSGRFTEVLATTEATIVSLDFSLAVEANAKSNAAKPNVLIVQGSVYELPFQKKSFDRVLCLGVLQHTPDPYRSFQALVEALRPGGDLAIDVYRWRWINWLWPRYWLRTLTKHLPSAFLYTACARYIEWVWPLTRWLHRLPQGRKLNRFILVPDFRDIYPLSEELLKQWAILDTFDNLSPTYDQPQRLSTVQRWFRDHRLEPSEVHYGINGIEGRGRAPLT